MRNLHTAKQWLAQGRIVLSNRTAAEIKISNKGFTYKLFAESDTRPMEVDEQVAFWLFEKIVPMRKDWFYQKRTERKGFKKSVDYRKKNEGLEDHCYPLTFQKVSAHFRGTGSTIGLTFKTYSSWYRIDLDNHLKNQYGKLIREFSLIYQFLLNHSEKLLKQGIRWFVEYRPDLTGVHFDFIFDEPVLLNVGRNMIRQILDELSIEGEVYTSDKCNCKLFGCVQYRMILDKIYKLPCLTELQDFLTDVDVYEHPSLAYVADALDFSIYPVEDFVPTDSSKGKTVESIPNNAELEKMIFKNSCWKNISDFFVGVQDHKVGELNKIVLVASMISFLDGQNEQEIVEKLLDNLESIDRERTVSSFYFLSQNEKEKRIKSLVHQAVQFHDKTDKNIEKLGAVALKFRETGRNVLDIETMRSQDSTERGLSSINILNVGAFSIVPDKIPQEYREEIINSLKELLPKKIKESAFDIALHLANICHSNNLRNKPVSRSLFNTILKNKFGWKPRTNQLQGKILERLIHLGVIKRTELRYTMFWGLGDRFARILDLTPSAKNYFNSSKLTAQQLNEIHSTTFDWFTGKIGGTVVG